VKKVQELTITCNIESLVIPFLDLSCLEHCTFLSLVTSDIRLPPNLVTLEWNLLDDNQKKIPNFPISLSHLSLIGTWSDVKAVLLDVAKQLLDPIIKTILVFRHGCGHM
jgi:hypothetical protein